MRFAPFALVALLAPLTAGCGVHEIDRPQAPAAVFPANVDVRRAPPAAGKTRLLLDANGERASVVDVVSSTSATAYVNGHIGVASAFGRIFSPRTSLSWARRRPSEGEACTLRAPGPRTHRQARRTPPSTCCSAD